EALAAALAESAADERLGVPETAAPEVVVVDYSSPNVAKEMHVGHIRTTVIGDALVRVLGFLGHRVIRQNHLGDWGTQFGMLIEHLVDEGWDLSGDHTIKDLNSLYRQAQERFQGDPEFADRARRRVVALQSGDETTLTLWRALVAESERHFEGVYERLGVLLEPGDVCGESFYNPMLPDVAADLERRGIAAINDGALCVFPPGFTNREGEPLPLIVRKQDGGYGYAATDLAAVRFRTGTLHATRILYVVGAPQAQHLAMVFALSAIAGWLVPPARAEHVAFGTVLGQDKKTLRSRKGEAVTLVELLDEAVERADAELAKRDVERGVDRGAAERRALAPAIGIGGVKYADLANDRIKDYVFDWERMLAPEGRTGPYLQYAHARIRSIFRKASEEGVEAPVPGAPIALAEPAERALGLELLGFGAAVLEAAESLKPHRLAGYLYDLAAAFTAFFENCPVLRAPDSATRASRLALCALTAAVLARGLDLLGIEAPDRM
ncbi:MAG TPA: arginine--tRNA ligase, partial [Gammaproteobacteria bacterium]|nr:arginine--tRNA ligase [Gammaproteobacteria bacterium]